MSSPYRSHIPSGRSDSNVPAWVERWIAEVLGPEVTTQAKPTRDPRWDPTTVGLLAAAAGMASVILGLPIAAVGCWFLATATAWRVPLR